jgi:hypothetical protein
VRGLHPGQIAHEEVCTKVEKFFPGAFHSIALSYVPPAQGSDIPRRAIVPENQMVSFIAQGVRARLWDQPAYGIKLAQHVNRFFIFFLLGPSRDFW